MLELGPVLDAQPAHARIRQAIARAYAGVLQISFDGMQYRRDIGRNALRSGD